MILKLSLLIILGIKKTFNSIGSFLSELSLLILEFKSRLAKIKINILVEAWSIILLILYGFKHRTIFKYFLFGNIFHYTLFLSIIHLHLFLLHFLRKINCSRFVFILILINNYCVIFLDQNGLVIVLKRMLQYICSYNVRNICHLVIVRQFSSQTINTILMIHLVMRNYYVLIYLVL